MNKEVPRRVGPETRADKTPGGKTPGDKVLADKEAAGKRARRRRVYPVAVTDQRTAPPVSLRQET